MYVSQNTFVIISTCLNLCTVFYGLIYIHYSKCSVYTCKEMYFVIVGCMLSKCQLGHVNAIMLQHLDSDFFSTCLVNYREKSAIVSSSNCGYVCFSFQLCQVLLQVFWKFFSCTLFRIIDYLMNSSFHFCKMFLFIPGYVPFSEFDIRIVNSALIRLVFVCYRGFF